MRGDPARIFDFCAAIVDATRDLVIAYKPQIAYFAANRAEEQLERLIAHIHRTRAGGAGDPRRQARRHGLDRRAVRARAVRSLPRRCGDAVAVPRLRFDRALSAPRRQGRDPALPHLQPRRRRPAGAASRIRRAAVRAHRPAGRRPVEHDRPGRPGRRRHLPGRDRPRPRARAAAAAADPRHRRARRRRRRDGAGRLARHRRHDHRADHRQLVARRALSGRRRGRRFRPRLAARRGGGTRRAGVGPPYSALG